MKRFWVGSRVVLQIWSQALIFKRQSKPWLRKNVAVRSMALAWKGIYLQFYSVNIPWVNDISSRSFSFFSYLREKITRLLCPRNSPGKNIGMGCHSLLQGIFPTHRSNWGLLYYRHILYQLSSQGSPLLRPKQEQPNVSSLKFAYGCAAWFLLDIEQVIKESPWACFSSFTYLHTSPSNLNFRNDPQ